MENPLLPQASQPTVSWKQPHNRRFKLLLVLGAIAVVAVCSLAIVGVLTLTTTNTPNSGDSENVPLERYASDVLSDLTPIFIVPGDLPNLDEETKMAASKKTCVCPRIVHQKHEEVLLNQEGSICAGGCGGESFIAHSYGELVRTLTVYQNDDTFVGVQVELTDGVSRVFGANIQSSSLNRQSFAFQLGEHIVGDVTIGSNSPWFSSVRVGYLSFSTSLNRTFQIGTPRNLFYFPANGRFLSGIFGRASSGGVDSLGLVFVKPVRTTNLVDVAYPTLSLLPTNMAPARLAKTILVNDAPNELTQTIAYTRTVGSSNCWTSRHTGLFGTNLNVKVGLLSIVKTNAGIRWEMSSETTHSECTNQSTTEATTTVITVPPRHRCEIEISQLTSPIDRLPFSANLQMTFTDGTSAAFRTSGTYTALSVSQETLERSCKPM